MVGRRYLCGVLWFIASLAICHGNDVMMKFLGQSVSPMQVIFLRNAIGALWLLPWFFARNSRFRSGRIWLHASRGIMLFAAMLLWCSGLRHVPLPTVMVVEFSIPLFLLLLARIFLRERVTRLRWGVTLLGFLGVAVVANPERGTFHAPVLLLLLAAALFSAVDVLNRRFARSEPIWPTLLYTALATAGCAAIPTAFAWSAMGLLDWVRSIALGAGSVLLFFCLLRALSLLEASAVAPYRYVEFIFSLISGYVFFGEVVTPATLLGAAIVIPTTLFLAYRESAEDAGNFRRCC
jgi:S-adenosylmethionine uptake transporter